MSIFNVLFMISFLNGFVVLLCLFLMVKQYSWVYLVVAIVNLFSLAWNILTLLHHYAK